MKRIQIKISPSGVTTIVDVQGYGASCTGVTSGLEARIGTADESSRASTASLFETPDEQVAAVSQG